MSRCRICKTPTESYNTHCLACYRGSAAEIAEAGERITALRIGQHDRDAFWLSKFDRSGNVRAGWSFERWIIDRVAGVPKTPSPLAEELTAA